MCRFTLIAAPAGTYLLEGYMRKHFRFLLCAAAAVLFSTALSLAPHCGIHADAAASQPVTVQSAQISGDSVVVSTAGSVSSGDDGLYYLIASDCYQSGADGTVVSSEKATHSNTFTFALGKNTAGSNLYKKFTVAVKRSGRLTAVSNSLYINNPDAAADMAAVRLDTGKKGVMLDASLINHTEYLNDLGARQIVYNLPIGALCKSGDYPYEYNGRTYYFNSAVISQYDYIVSRMNKAGCSVSLVLLNNKNGDPSMIHPYSRDNNDANYYAFNTGEAAGAERLEAIADFLGGRYSGGAHGTVDNYIIGNEVNARQEWNYMNASRGMTTVADEYGKALRIFYNGILSRNANARVYASIDHEWAASDNPPMHYPGMNFLIIMNRLIRNEGNFNYGVATHPFNLPLFKSQTWEPDRYHNNTMTTPFITMANIDQFTDFFCQNDYRQTDGQVRSILLPEIGYTSISANGCTSSENIQAAATAYAYLQVMNNQYIDGFFNRQTDSQYEIESSGMAEGLLTTDYKIKPAYIFYKGIDNPSTSASIIAQTSNIIGQDVMKLIHAR